MCVCVCLSFVRTHQDQEHGAVAQQRQDGHHPDDDPQQLGGHDVLAGVEVVGHRRADHGGGPRAVVPVEEVVSGGLGVEAQLAPPRPDTHGWGCQWAGRDQEHPPVFMTKLRFPR